MGKAKKLKYSFDEEEDYEREHSKTCEYCGKIIEDTNDTGSLCYRCYMREYYPETKEYDY